LAKLDHGAIWMTILVQLFFISLSYTGFNASIYLAGEIDREQIGGAPSNQPNGSNMLVPRSMIIACLLVTAIYLGLNYLFLACDTREAILAGGDYFVSDVAYDVGGSTLRWVMRITIALSSATSVLAMLATGPRVYAQMAADGWLPSWLGFQNDVPRAAIGIQAALSIALVWLANILDMISYLGITLTVCGALATSTLWIAYQAMSDRRPIAWWEHAALAVYIAGALLLLIAAWFVKPMQFWCCLATFASGFAVYLVSRGRSERRPIAG
jgi:APA family basic amino acid/polyamine antiporter